MVGCPLSVDASKAVPNDVDDASHRRVFVAQAQRPGWFTPSMCPPVVGRRIDPSNARGVSVRAFVTTTLFAVSTQRHDDDDIFFIGIDDARAHPFDERVDDHACGETYHVARARVIVVVVERKRRNKDYEDEQRVRKKG